MSDKKDKEIEMLRYNERAAQINYLDQVKTLPKWLFSPILKYYSLIRENVSDKNIVLEIGSGTGNHTQALLETGACVWATDISQESLKLLKSRFSQYPRLNISSSDMELMEFPDNSFDAVVSAGSLSYGDNDKVLLEIHRVLRIGGVFICMDSLNHNPIYRINRRIHVIRNKRTRSTIRNMPKIQLFQKYKEKYGSIKIYYFGSITWLAPIIGFIFGETFARKISDFVDNYCRIKKSAFKFVFIVKKDLE